LQEVKDGSEREQLPMVAAVLGLTEVLLKSAEGDGDDETKDEQVSDEDEGEKEGFVGLA
jgi:hypothetical protein